MQLFYFTALALTLFGAPHQTPGTDSHIRVLPAEVTNRITPWMTGSCIEDVNHEIYGGLYAQRIFGESFEEPPNAAPLAGWSRYGGEWRIANGVLTVASDAGAKLVRNQPAFRDGSVSCDIQLLDTQADNAGLILRVSDPHTGPDRWTGYEISLNARNKTILIGRHQNNWELKRVAAAPVEVGRWHRLRVDLAGSMLRVFLDDGPAPLLEYTAENDALGVGQVGLRTWNSNAAFRKLTITTAGRTLTEPLDNTEPPDDSAAISGMWDAISTGNATARYTWDGDNAYNSAHSQRITYLAGTGTVGLCNRGLNRWGIAVHQGKSMAGHLYLRQSGTPVPITVALQSADGTRTYTQQVLSPPASEWTRRDFNLHPGTTDPNARFAIWLDRPGTVGIDQVFLSETGKALFRGLPLRADIGEKLVDEGLTFMRYGGTMVNAAEYRWKKMIGPRDKRPQYRGFWYAPGTNGFGIEDFVQFCEKAHIEPAFAINIEETPEDAADLVEYLNGPITSVWGAKRAANGHPQPYHVRYIEIGNEEVLGGNLAEYLHYLERFKRLYAAMRPHDPNINYVIAAWWRPDEPLCKQIAQELSDKAALWDVHIDADGLHDAEKADRTLTQMQQLFREWIPGSPLRACVFEENGDRHDLQRALGHARILNMTQRHGDFVRIDCPANCLQPLGQNDNGWNQGQLFFLPDKVWAMPPYYAQQMAAANYLPLCVECDADSPNHDLDATATRSEDGKTLVLKVVNSGEKAHQAALQLGDFASAVHSADVWTLSGDLQAENTPDVPEHIHPVHTRLDISGASRAITFPPYSYTILRLQKR